jgi:Xaa-Pro aminopeptidase
MKSDLDSLMHERGFDALLVTGPALNNPAMYYLANGVHIGERSVLIKKRGRAPILFVSGMERDEAAKSGLRVVDFAKFKMPELIRAAKGNLLVAYAGLYSLMLAEAEVKGGTVAVYGVKEQGAAYALLNTLRELNPDITIAGEFGKSILSLARYSKDPEEIKRIKVVGKKTVQVVASTAEFLSSHRAQKGYLVKKDGLRLTIGDVKRHIRLALLEQNIVDAEGGTIFALGRDAGVPHSRGNVKDPIALGQTIVYDIFPAEPGGGYYFDFTRTWCVGHAPDEVLAAYDDVLGVFKKLMKAFRPNELCRTYQKMTCDYFEERGHPTIQSNYETTDGYVHSLAHGVGLQIHERPHFSDVEGNDDRIMPGTVFTVEPGLYYPERGFGIRLEDTVWLNPTTLKFEPLAKYPMDLVIPHKRK